MQVEIDANKYARDFVGKKTLEQIRKDVEEYHKQGITDIVINVDDKSMSKDYTKYVAEMIYEYGCTFKGLGGKEETVKGYLNTGYFIKENIGAKRYVEWMENQIRLAGFPLMILDNSLRDARNLVPLNIIQPERFDDKYFYYSVIKPTYLEPVMLEEAIRDGKDIYRKESVNRVDIATEEMGFRFATTKRERTILDIFTEILNRNFR